MHYKEWLRPARPTSQLFHPGPKDLAVKWMHHSKPVLQVGSKELVVKLAHHSEAVSGLSQRTQFCILSLLRQNTYQTCKSCGSLKRTKCLHDVLYLGKYGQNQGVSFACLAIHQSWLCRTWSVEV